MDIRGRKEEATQGIIEEAAPGTQEDQPQEVKIDMGKEGKDFPNQEAEGNQEVEDTATLEGTDNQGEVMTGREEDPDIQEIGKGAGQVTQETEVERETEAVRQGEAGVMAMLKEASPEVLQDIAMEEEGLGKMEAKAQQEVVVEVILAETIATGVEVLITRQQHALCTEKEVMGNAEYVNGSIDLVTAKQGEMERKRFRVIAPLDR